IAKSIIPQGKFNQADSIVNELVKLSKKRSEDRELLFLELELYDNYSKPIRHLNSSKMLTQIFLKNGLSSDEFKILNYQVSKKAAEWQKSATSDVYKQVRSTRLKRAKLAYEYFSLSSYLNRDKTSEPLFYKAETAYGVDEMPNALSFYEASYE